MNEYTTKLAGKLVIMGCNACYLLFMFWIVGIFGITEITPLDKCILSALSYLVIRSGI